MTWTDLCAEISRVSKKNFLGEHDWWMFDIHSEKFDYIGPKIMLAVDWGGGKFRKGRFLSMQPKSEGFICVWIGTPELGPQAVLAHAKSNNLFALLSFDEATLAPIKKIIPETCPKCNDCGEWRSLALTCRNGHGVFQG